MAVHAHVATGIFSVAQTPLHYNSCFPHVKHPISVNSQNTKEKNAGCQKSSLEILKPFLITKAFHPQKESTQSNITEGQFMVEPEAEATEAAQFSGQVPVTSTSAFGKEHNQNVSV